MKHKRLQLLIDSAHAEHQVLLGRLAHAEKQYSEAQRTSKMLQDYLQEQRGRHVTRMSRSVTPQDIDVLNRFSHRVSHAIALQTTQVKSLSQVEQVSRQDATQAGIKMHSIKRLLTRRLSQEKSRFNKLDQQLTDEIAQQKAFERRSK